MSREPLSEKFGIKGSGIYAIADTKTISDARLLGHIEQALKAGVVLLQYRDKRPDKKNRAAQAERVLTLCKHYQVPLLINDDVELAKHIGADGVHLGQSDLDIKQARGLLGEDAFIGVTCHNSLKLAEDAVSNSANYVAFGRLFPSNTKPSAPPADIQTIETAAQRFADRGISIVAIGGIKASHIPNLIKRGVDYIACIESVFGGQDVFNDTKALVQAIETSSR